MINTVTPDLAIVTTRPSGPRPLLGEEFVRRGLVSEQQIKQALEVQRRSNAFLGQILVDLGFISPSLVGAQLAETFGVAYIDLLNVQPEPEAIALVPEDVIRSAQSLPIRVTGNVVHVAMVDPLDVAAIDKIHLLTGHRVIPMLTMAGELLRAIDSLFDARVRTSAVLEELETEETDADRARPSQTDLAMASEAPIVRLVDSLIESALALNASDIHFEPQERGLRVRYRVDGLLMEQTLIPRPQIPAVISRLKVLGVMDITESRRPQDGRMRYDHHGRAFDIRISAVPTVHGEKLVLRILDKSSVLVPLTKLGFLPEQQKRFEDLIGQPHGMLLVVGPTGSGKSTTLYSALNMINDSTRNIMTLEDPVEYDVNGINQIQVNARIGLTFASGLRSFVRQDPDVILVGEIRDNETAEMAIQAALTGHLLLSTLHTNSAIGTLARLSNLGVDPFLISQALSGVISQRLVAKVCLHCAADYHPPAELIESIGLRPDQAARMRFKKGRGCRACYGRGYSGRMGLFEILTIDDTLRRLIMRSASEEEIEEVAKRRQMLLLRDSAIAAVAAGITTPEEMGRVVLHKEI